MPRSLALTGTTVHTKSISSNDKKKRIQKAHRQSVPPVLHDIRNSHTGTSPDAQFKDLNFRMLAKYLTVAVKLFRILTPQLEKVLSIFEHPNDFDKRLRWL